MKIIKIVRNKLYLDNEEIIDINLDIRHIYSLKVGKEIDEIYKYIVYESMKNKAIYLISLKERTIYSLKNKLKEKYLKHNHYIIDDVIQDLIDLKLVDDVDYAKRYIELYKFKSENTIRKNLISKGISFNDINIAFEELSNYIDLNEEQKNNILKIVQKSINLPKDKLIRRLFNKGYKYDLIMEVINENY